MCATATNLPDFLRSNFDLILERWEQFARGIPAARHMDRTDLRDHAGGMLSAIINDLERGQNPPAQADKPMGKGPRSARETYAAMHGANREYAGFSIVEVISEFRSLRVSVLRLWSESNTTSLQTASDELTQFNEAIDHALSESLARYATDLGRLTNLFNTLLSSSQDLHFIFDIEGKLIYVNQSFANVFGMSADQADGKSFMDLGVPNALKLQQEIQHVLETKTTYRGEEPCRLPFPKEGRYECIFIPVQDEKGNVEAIVGTARDITQRLASEEEIRKSANYDFLTGLPNRGNFRARLEAEVKRTARTGRSIALLFIDLDSFKEVNDLLGHAAGDQLLQQAALRITSCIRDTDMAARLGGDEFTVLLTEVNKIFHVEILAQEILDALAQPFPVLGKDVHISGSIGITLFPQDATKPDDLIRNADQAMYVAKNAGRNRFSFFTSSMREAAWARLEMIDELRHALQRRQFDVYYQPIVDLADGRIVKAEALVRWNHPRTGLTLPGNFIALAEEAGLINEIDEWVFGEAVMRARDWSALLGASFQISVNKSPLEFMTTTRAETWNAQLACLGVFSNNITVEITEGVLLNDSPRVRKKLDTLQHAGIQLAIDDFGTGYSSMAYLKKFKVDYLKIDPSFVQDMITNMNSRTIAETIIVMAHKLGLKVIAEGVETPEQRDWLIEAECDYAQGYLYSKPVPSQDFYQLLGKGAMPPTKLPS